MYRIFLLLKRCKILLKVHKASISTLWSLNKVHQMPGSILTEKLDVRLWNRWTNVVRGVLNLRNLFQHKKLVISLWNWNRSWQGKTCIMQVVTQQVCDYTSKDFKAKDLAQKRDKPLKLEETVWFLSCARYLICLLLQAEKWCNEGMDRLGTRWMRSPDVPTTEMARDIDQFLAQSSTFKLDNPKEFHTVFSSHATQEMKGRLPEVSLVCYIRLSSAQDRVGPAMNGHPFKALGIAEHMWTAFIFVSIYCIESTTAKRQCSLGCRILV